MKRLKTFEQMVNSTKGIYEMAINPEKLETIKRLREAGDVSGMLKTAKPIIKQIIDICKDINYDEIVYRKTKDVIKIFYKDPVRTLLSSLNDIANVGGEIIEDKIFTGGWDDTTLDIEMDSDMTNRIDIMNGLPNFMKGIGLGKKIYKKLIKDFGYISTYNGYDPSLDSSMVWNSLAKEKDIYTFINGENIICFWYGLDFDIITDVLKLFYENGDMIIDNDFIDKYNLDEKEYFDKIKNR